MKVWLSRIAAVFAVAFLVLTFTNASWLAETPRGIARQVAHRAVAQYYDPAGVGVGDCVATRIEEPSHPYIEDTVASVVQARRMAAGMIEVDVSPTADGQVVAFPDATLDCRTEGKGPVRAKTLAELQQLDAGYGYSADGGKSFPLRGQNIGAIPPVEAIVKALPESAILFHFTSAEAGDVDLLLKALKAAGRDSAKRGDGFHGSPAQVERIRAQLPKNWAWSDQGADDCGGSYMLYGWTGIMPESCKDGTMIVPLDRQWEFWGFPNRLIARMAKVGGRIVVAGPHGANLAGLSLPEQIGEVPSTFNGYLWVDDMWNIGPALHSSIDRRNGRQIELAEKALEARRAKQ